MYKATQYTEIIRLVRVGRINSQFTVDLDKHVLKIGDKVVWIAGRFIADVCNIPKDIWNELEMVPVSKNWRKDLTWLYGEYCKCRKSSLPGRKYFLPAQNSSQDLVLSIDKPPLERKLAIELFVLFQSELGVIQLSDNTHWAETVCKGCAVYRNWILR